MKSKKEIKEEVLMEVQYVSFTGTPEDLINMNWTGEQLKEIVEKAIDLTIKKATQLFEDDLDEVMKKLKEELEKDTKFNVLTFDFVFDKIDKLKKEFKNKLKEARG